MRSCLCALPLILLGTGLLASVTWLVVLIQIYTLVHKKEPLNYYHLVLMSLFLLIIACMKAPDAVVGLVMGLFLVSAISTLMLIQSFKEAVACSGAIHKGDSFQ